MAQTDTSLNVLLIGGGGREHALAQAIKRSPRLGTLFATHTANPGIAALAEPTGLMPDRRELERLFWFCEKRDIGLVVIGPEDPLADGVADVLGKRDGGGERPVFGPRKDAARLEADKSYAKELMRAASIPTAESRTFRSADQAVAFLESRDEPMVVKAAGLARGKGVIVPETVEEAISAVHRIMDERAFGDAGARVVIEEKLSGKEVSVQALVDSNSVLMLPACRDHKRLGEGDTGPNTGGMGAFCPSHDLDETDAASIERGILIAIVDALRREGVAFRGVLYAGLMLTPAGPKVLEFNVRFGDPECQPMLARLASDPLDLLLRTASGTLAGADPAWSDDAAVTVVLAAAGYPDAPRKGDVITGVDQAEKLDGVTIQHAGTALDDKGRLVTAGGRVPNVTATGPTLEAARDRAYEAAGRIDFPGRLMRRDIASA